MLTLGVSTLAQEQSAAAALATAVSMATTAWDYVYTLMAAAALRFMLPEMRKKTRGEDSVMTIVENGWKLTSDFMRFKECQNFRADMTEQILSTTNDLIPETKWKATSRIMALFVIFATLLENLDDDSFSQQERIDLLRSLFLGLQDLPWYPSSQTDEISENVLSSIRTIFKILVYVPTSKFTGLTGALDHDSARKNTKVVKDLFCLYEFGDIKCTPVTLFAQIRAIVNAPGATKFYLPPLLDEFRLGYAARTAAPEEGRLLNDQRRPPPKYGKTGGTVPPQRANKNIPCSTLDWPIEYLDAARTKPRSPRDGEPPAIAGLTVRYGSAERWQKKKLLRALSKASLRGSTDEPPAKKARVEVVPPPLPPAIQTADAVSGNEIDSPISLNQQDGVTAFESLAELLADEDFIIEPFCNDLIQN